jgi:hypothetical protein
VCGAGRQCPAKEQGGFLDRPDNKAFGHRVAQHRLGQVIHDAFLGLQPELHGDKPEHHRSGNANAKAGYLYPSDAAAKRHHGPSPAKRHGKTIGVASDSRAITAPAKYAGCEGQYRLLVHLDIFSMFRGWLLVVMVSLRLPLVRRNTTVSTSAESGSVGDGGLLKYGLFDDLRNRNRSVYR